MLGHQLVKSWSGSHQISTTLRSGPEAYHHPGLFPAERTFYNIDVRESSHVLRVLQAVRPDAVVNAVGVVKQRESATNVRTCLEVNALLPHRLNEWCREIGARLIHLSTDCIFNGKQGNYTEADPCDVHDTYGLTKYLGEVSAEPALTLRTSIIGTEIAGGLSLVEWFLAQRGTIRGFTRAIYTGVTTIEMARIIEHVLLAHPTLTGLFQVASAPISKYDLLQRLRNELGLRHLNIQPCNEFACDRSLSGDAFAARTGFQVASWDTMIQELAREISNRGISSVAS